MTVNRRYILILLVILVTGALPRSCEAALFQDYIRDDATGAVPGVGIFSRSGLRAGAPAEAYLQEGGRPEPVSGETEQKREQTVRAWHEPILVRVMIFIGLLLLIYLVMRLLYHRQNLQYSWKMERMEKAKIAEINEAKIRFFTDLSHDLKTPLTLIQGPIEKLYRSGSLTLEEVQKMLPVIYRNSNRLTILIEELLTFRELNDGRLPLHASRQDMVAFLESILDYYDTPVRERRIRIERSLPGEPLEAWFDQFKLEQVFHNLLSNAIKYGNKGGRMRISLTRTNVPGTGEPGDSMQPVGDGRWLRITVFNEAEPIPPEKLEHLFDRFYKLNDNSSGTGIGLSVVKSLVELHHGFITARSSRELGGVEFEIVLPGDDSYLDESEKADSSEYRSMVNKLPGAPGTDSTRQADEARPAKGARQADKARRSGGARREDEARGLDMGHQADTALESGEPSHTGKIQSAGKKKQKQKKKYSLVLIEDNHDLREFLVHSLETEYKLWSAENGKAGLELAQEHMPDIVVSDVVMPVMDGFELVSRLKEDIQTSHIPVVLLTARTADTDKITGYRSGADAYVEKPFNLEVLEEQIRRVIRNREIMQNNFKEWVNRKEKPEDLSPEDHSFVALINKHIEANLSKGEISVNDISEAVGLSTTQVYRKVKALTNYTPIEYIRYRKLTRAQELLPNHKYSIKEISYMSGFNDPSYFGKCFKNEFGMSPQAFRESYVEYEIRERGEERQDD